ncbi:hypothetical protein [Haloarcula amylovorans]|uniref:hypothetical protein n=1 Tax=Haloarcula amylovorans TaxID=2562280 RepID=UPI001075E8F1|nr:hypothetical protein [Halomicroarcula amylolytica]
MDQKWNSVFLYQHAGQDTLHQLENNTSKNLLTILRDTDRSFAQWLLSSGFSGVDWKGFELKKVDTQVSLNSDDITESLDDGAKGYLLGISRYGEQVGADERPTRNNSSTIDGWLVLQDNHGEKRFIGIEVKTYSDKLEPTQMAKYRHQLQIPPEPEHPRAGTLTWGQLYNEVTSRVPQKYVEEQLQHKLEKDEYLWNEFAKSLRFDQLEVIIAQNDGPPYKRLWMRPAIAQPDSDANYEITLTWENTTNVTKSRLGWMGTNIFEDLLTQLPRPVREATFGEENISYQRFVDALYDTDEYAEIEDKKNMNISRKELPDGSDRAFRMKWITDEDDNEIVSKYPHFRIVKYYSSGKYAQGSSPNLDPIAFESLFESIPIEIREQALIGNPEPDLSSLWEHLVHNEDAFQDPRL